MEDGTDTSKLSSTLKLFDPWAGNGGSVFAQEMRHRMRDDYKWSRECGCNNQRYGVEPCDQHTELLEGITAGLIAMQLVPSTYNVYNFVPLANDMAKRLLYAAGVFGNADRGAERDQAKL